MSFSNFAEKALIHAGVTAASTMIISGSNAQVILPYLNTKVPIYYVGAIAGAATSVANDLMHSMIMPDVPINKKVRSESAVVLGIALSALIFAGSLYAVNPSLPEEFGMLNTLGVGALGEVISGYTLDIIRE